MIPKVIHYCWFGGNQLPKMTEKCISSWQKYCPDYEIKRWDESNYDYKKSNYTREAYEEKKWAFVSDLARLEIIYNNGGIYLDTDVELIKPLDDLLDLQCFLGTERGEQAGKGSINTGLGFGAEKGNLVVQTMIDKYKGIHYRGKNGIYDNTPCPTRNTAALQQYGYSFEEKKWETESVTVFPPEYFCPINYHTGGISITDKTYSIHHFSSTWITNEDEEIQKAIKNVIENNPWFIGKIKKNLLLYKNLKKQGKTRHFLSFIGSKIKYKVLNKL